MQDRLATVAAEVERIDALKKQRVETPCGDGTLVWRCWGEGGTPIVFLHGGHGSWMHWIRNVVPLSQKREVWAIDMPGFGESASCPAPVGREMLATIIAAGLDQIFGDRHIDLGGFSFGGSIGNHVAALQPERFRRYILIGSGGLPARRNRKMAPLRTWKNLADLEESRAAHHFNLGALMIHNPDKIDDLALYVQETNAKRTRTKSGPRYFSDDTMPQLSKVKARLFGIWGDCDLTCFGHFDDRKELLRQVDPDAPFHLIKGAGHWVQYEAAERFNALVDEILSA